MQQSPKKLQISKKLEPIKLFEIHDIDQGNNLSQSSELELQAEACDDIHTQSIIETEAIKIEIEEAQNTEDSEYSEIKIEEARNLSTIENDFFYHTKTSNDSEQPNNNSYEQPTVSFISNITQYLSSALSACYSSPNQENRNQQNYVATNNRIHIDRQR